MRVGRRMNSAGGWAFRAAAIVLSLCCGRAWSDTAAGITAFERGDYAAAAIEFQSAVRRDEPVAQNMLGIMYAEGRGVARNDKLAADLFSKAQVMGSLEAAGNLGRMYAEGRGVPQDNQIALKLFHEAAQGGYQPAMLRLAEVYENGLLGVTVNPEQANAWRARVGGTPAGRLDLRQLPVASKAQPAAPSSSRVLAKSPAKLAAAPVKTNNDDSALFERQVLERLEKYLRRERKLLVASNDNTAALAQYLKELRNRIRMQVGSAFAPSKSSPGMMVTVMILRDGTLRGIELDQGSGDRKLDNKILSSLKKLGQLTALPAEIAAVADVLGVTVKLPLH